MASSVSYSIFSSGGVVDGHEPDTVISEFCTIFGVHKDKAALYIEQQKLIKKDLNEAQAIAYREKFTEIGIPTTLKKHEVEMPDEFGGLSLSPANEPDVDATPVTTNVTAETNATGAVATNAGTAQSIVAPPKGFCCPKCDKEQERSDTCVSCGIIFEKYVPSNDSRKRRLKSDASGDANDARSREAVDVDERGGFFEDFELSLASIGVALVIVIVGAFVWRFLAVNMGTEYAIAAWAIGAAIGGGAALIGTQSDMDGVLCAILLVLAIAGGKYMTAGAYADEYNATSLIESEEIAELLEEYRDDARRFSQVSGDDKSIKRFIAKYGYADVENYNEIGSEELAYFQNFAAPMLTEIHTNKTDLDNSSVLYSILYGEEAPELTITRGELFSALWGPFDLLFLLLGMASAFKLASGRDLK